MEWISIKDRLPEQMKKVLVFDGFQEEKIRYHNGSGEWFDDNDFFDDSETEWSHWMPLPPPPTAKEE